MAENGFDFGALKALKLAQYAKEHCKTTEVKKAGAALIFLDYKMAGKKTPCVVVPFKKMTDAAKAFKDAKASKEHLMKKTGLAELTIKKGADGKDEIIVDLKKGGISPELLKLKGTDLFINTIGMALKAIGCAEKGADGGEGEPEEAEETEETPTSKEDNIKEEASANKDKEDNAKKEANKAARAAKIAQMNENVNKMEKVANSAPKDKMDANIQKYEDALAQLTKAALADGVVDKKEQAQIDALKAALDALRTAVNNNVDAPKGKKLSPEQKVKIKENMTKINARLEAIVKKLGL